MKEKEVERKHKKYNKEFIKIVGHKRATTNHELDYIGRNHIKNFIGVYPQDSKIPKVPVKASFIINVDTRNKPGSHWIAVHRSRNNIYYIFDSFGRVSTKLLPIFVRNKLHIDSDYDENQNKNSEICGTLCLAWLKCVDVLGIRNALKI